MIPAILFVVLLLIVAGVLNSMLFEKYRSVLTDLAETRRTLEGEQEACRCLARRLIYSIRSKRCVLREARRWKEECTRLARELNIMDRSAAAAAADNSDYWKERHAALMRRWIDAEKRCLAEVAANNRAFDAGVRAHAAGVVNYTGDEPTGDTV